MNKTIILFSEPRSGTSHLINILGSLSMVREVGEPFKVVKKYLYSLVETSFWETGNTPPWKKLTGLNEYFKSAEEIHSTICDSPGNYLNIIKSCTDINIHLIGKLFPNQCRHFGIDYINMNSKWNSLISVVDVAVIAKRCPVDTYISWKKAKPGNAWRDIDTTNKRIQFDIKEFKRWESVHYNWYTTLNKIPLPKVEYIYELEKWHDPQVICSKFINHVDGIFGDYVPGELLVKQDLSSTYDEKILNYRQVETIITDAIECYNTTLI